MSQWLGCMVSIDCINDKGIYQGEIVSASSSKIILTKAFCDGFPCNPQEVTILANEISNLKLIDKESIPAEYTAMPIERPVAKRMAHTQTSSESCATNKGTSQPINHTPGSSMKSKPIDIEYKSDTNEPTKMSTPNSKKDKMKGRWSKDWRNEACFGSPLDDAINKDFDFEKNLALFDKQALWNELNNSQKPDVLRHISQNKKKFRHDENIIVATPPTYRQIHVPKQELCEYVTDDGLIVPSISKLLKHRLFIAAEKAGLSWERNYEIMGRATTEMALQLLGGGHRLNPHNSHQIPTVVVFCGPSRQGAMGLNAARHISSHGINTIVFLVDTDLSFIRDELSLFKLTRNQIITKISELPPIVDLIIVALNEDSGSSRSYSDVPNWVEKNRSAVLALDPPAFGTPGILAKVSLVPLLPLPHSPANGKIYLCNLGFPIMIYNELRITYKSPFGSKFIIPLHPNEEM